MVTANHMSAVLLLDCPSSRRVGLARSDDDCQTLEGTPGAPATPGAYPREGLHNYGNRETFFTGWRRAGRKAGYRERPRNQILEPLSDADLGP